MSCENPTTGRTVDIEELVAKGERLKKLKFARPSLDDARKLKPMIQDFLARMNDTGYTHDQEWLKTCFRKYKFGGKNSFVLQSYRELVHAGDLPEDPEVDEKVRLFLQIKAGKSSSGVVVITLFFSGIPTWYSKKLGKVVSSTFTCPADCHFCPNEKYQKPDGSWHISPRSYLTLEPGVLRAYRNDYDCRRQMYDRMVALYNIGHDIDKLEIILNGGTFSAFNRDYVQEYVTHMYYAANTLWDYMTEIRNTEDHDILKRLRHPLSLEEEIEINKSAKTKVIGLTLETRPDAINPSELRFMRRLGCTRIQLGIQHIDNDVLEAINRGCTTEQARSAVKMLKDCGFKWNAHAMCNLPGSSPDRDRDMLINRWFGLKKPIIKYQKGDEYWEEHDYVEDFLQCDDLKIYPCQITPWTEIKNMFARGEYIPYDAQTLKEVIYDVTQVIPPFTRCSRVIRDIPSLYDIEGEAIGNMRDVVETMLAKNGKQCKCIRCREVKTEEWNGVYRTVVRKFDSADGIEFFISAESDNDKETLYGFVRLRLPSNKINEIFDELWFCSICREVHSYGSLKATHNATSKSNVQHRGIGKKLMSVAERIAKEHGWYRMAVIAGIGARGFYERLGYKLSGMEGGYMIKDLV